MKTDEILDIYLGKRHLKKLLEFAKPTIYFERQAGFLGALHFNHKGIEAEKLFSVLIKGFDVIYDFCESNGLDFIESNGLTCSFVGEAVDLGKLEKAIKEIKQLVSPELVLSIALHKGDYLLGDFGPQKRLKKTLAGENVKIVSQLAYGGLSKNWDMVVTNSVISETNPSGYTRDFMSVIVGFNDLEVYYKILN